MSSFFLFSYALVLQIGYSNFYCDFLVLRYFATIWPPVLCSPEKGPFRHENKQIKKTSFSPQEGWTKWEVGEVTSERILFSFFFSCLGLFGVLCSGHLNLWAPGLHWTMPSHFPAICAIPFFSLFSSEHHIAAPNPTRIILLIFSSCQHCERTHFRAFCGVNCTCIRWIDSSDNTVASGLGPIYD